MTSPEPQKKKNDGSQPSKPEKEAFLCKKTVQLLSFPRENTRSAAQLSS